MKVNGAIFNYSQYIDWLSNLVSQGKTSGKNQSAALIQFTALNLKRMERLNKTIEIENSILGITSIFWGVRCIMRIIFLV